MKKTAEEKKREAESKLLEHLQDRHGYGLQDAPRGKRVSMMMRKVNGKTIVEPTYRVMLSVPCDSALGRALASRYGEDKPKAKRR